MVDPMFSMSKSRFFLLMTIPLVKNKCSKKGGKWSDIVACQPVRCKALPPPIPADGTMTVIKSLDPTTNDQAETILTYTCSQPYWAFNYPYDESLPSFAFTVNIHNITSIFF